MIADLRRSFGDVPPLRIVEIPFLHQLCQRLALSKGGAG